MTALLATVAPPIVSDLADRPVRWSILSQPTPAHMRHAALFGKEPTAAMKLGTAGHAVAFEVPFEVFDAVSPKTGEVTTRNSKAWKEFEADCIDRGVVPLMPAEYEKACAIRDALHACADARDLLFGADVLRETRLTWIREGRACSGIPDARRPGDTIADLKVVRSSDPAPHRFPRSARDYGYPGQLVFYREADCIDRGVRVDSLLRADLYNVAVESAPPHAVTVFRLDHTAQAYGERLLRAKWEVFRNCEASNAWPAYSQSVVEMSIDDFSQADDDDSDDDHDGYDKENL